VPSQRRAAFRVRVVRSLLANLDEDLLDLQLSSGFVLDLRERSLARSGCGVRFPGAHELLEDPRCADVVVA